MDDAADVRASIARLFAAVDAIDAHVAARQQAYPNRGHLSCPNCAGTLVYANLTDLKGAARCDTPNCVDFAPCY